MVRQREDDKYYWIQYLHQRIRNNKNFLGITTGPTGSGKSYTALSIGEMTDKNFDVDRVVFTGRELMDLINNGNLKKGSVIIWDEAGIDLSSRSWQSLTNKMINFLIQTFRHKNFILLFTTPYSSFVDKATRKLFHAEFRTVSIDYKKKTCKIKPQLIQYNSRMDKFYYKYLRIVTKKGVVPLVEWNVPSPSPELVKKYEAKKTAFTKQLNREIESQLNKDNKELPKLQEKIKKCWERGIFLQKDIAEELNITQPTVSASERGLRGRGVYKKDYQKIDPIDYTNTQST